MPFLATISDLAQALMSLLPVGEVWPRDTEAMPYNVATALVPTQQRLRARALNLTVDAFPATAVELLPEWELTCGLPDPCAGPDPILSQRQQQVVARFAGSGGQSAAHIAQYALNLGFYINITMFTPARCGVASCGMGCQGETWAFTWSIQSDDTTVTYSKCGSSQCGDPLATWGNAVLVCEMNSIKPAHTSLFFTYGFTLDQSMLDGSPLD